jgi:hypothetical protein
MTMGSRRPYSVCGRDGLSTLPPCTNTDTRSVVRRRDSRRPTPSFNSSSTGWLAEKRARWRGMVRRVSRSREYVVATAWVNW